MLRCGNLNGNNITYDKDITNLLHWIYNQGVISGFQVTSGNVSAGKAILFATRTNGEVVAIAIENTSNYSIDTSGTKKVYITINQAKFDDGSENNVDGTGIVSIATGASYPASNCIKLASISGGLVTDEREYVSLKSNKINGNLNFINGAVPQLNGVGLNVANGLVKLNGSGKVDPSLFEVSFDTGGLSETTTPQNGWFTMIYNGTTNLKTSLLNLVKGLLPTNLTENTSPTTSFIVTLFNGTSNVKTTLANLVKGLAYATKTAQGVLRLATDAEATAGSVDTVAITAKQAKDNYGVIILPGDGEFVVRGGSADTSSGTYVKMAEIKINKAGTYRLKAEVFTTSGGGSNYTADVAIYKNNSLITSATTPTGNSGGRTALAVIDTSLSVDDTISAYILVTGSRSAKLNYLKVCGNVINPLWIPSIII